MTVSAHFDESGKFKDHDVISIGCVGGFAERFENGFVNEWGTLLNAYGLKAISGKATLNYNKPLSAKNPCLGLQDRMACLLSFISCIRKHVQVVTGLAVDAKEFKKLPSYFFKTFGNNPAFMAFVRSAMYMTDFTPDNDKLTLICDDDEETAWEFYRLYRRVKKVWPDARKKFGGIAFVDDRYLFGVQASDLIASIMRLEANLQLNNAKYDYGPAFQALTAQPEKQEPWLWQVAISIARKETLIETAESIKDHYEKVTGEIAR
jgi:hypothetical protein